MRRRPGFRGDAAQTAGGTGVTVSDSEWDLEVRPRKTARYAIGVAVLLVVLFSVVGALLRTSATGVYFRAADQVAMVLFGFLLAGLVLLLTRPRLRVNASGVDVRNGLGEKHIDWDLVQGLSFPDGAAWARIELPDDEYVPVLAIQANDKQHAVEAVQAFRALDARHRR